MTLLKSQKNTIYKTIERAELSPRDFRWEQRDGEPLHRIVHDLRRTAARDMRRAGASESDIMELCGWETRAMFERYCIKDEKALAAAVGKRFKVQQRSNIPPALVSPESLTSDAAIRLAPRPMAGHRTLETRGHMRLPHNPR